MHAAVAFMHRSKESRDRIVSEVIERVWPLIETGVVEPFVHRELFPFSKVQEAHQLMETEGHSAKIILVPDEILKAAREQDGITRSSEDKVFVKY